MTNTRTENAAKNIFAGYINRIITMIMPFISRTVILYVLGSQYLGLSSLFTSILQMLNMAELGFSSAIVFSLYKPLIENDESTVCGLMEYYKRIYRIIGMVIFVIGVAITPFLSFLVKGEMPSYINIYVIYLIYLFNTCVSYWAFAYKNSLLQASQKMSISSNVQSIVNCLQYMIQIILLLVTKNYYAYIVVLPIGTVCCNVVSAMVADKLYPQYTHKGSIPKEVKVNLSKQIKGLAITMICGVMRNSLASITLSAFVGLVSVAIYGNYFYVISSIHGVLTVVTSSIRAGVGNSLSMESKEKNTADMFKFDFLYSFIYSWCFTCIFCLYQDFMKIWAGNELLLSGFCMSLFAFYFYSLCMSDIRNVYIEASGLWWEYRLRAILEAIAHLILNVTFVYFWGIPGVIIATLITYWGINVLYGTTIIFNKYFGRDKVKVYYSQNAKRFVITVIITAFTYCAGYFIPCNNLILLFIKAVVCGLVGLTLELLIYMKNPYLKEFSKLIKRRFIKSDGVNMF